MYPTHVIKIDTEKTHWGEVVILLVDGQRSIAFPDFIDSTDSQSIDALYDTFEWPLGWSLEDLPDFPKGKPLAGWDILGAYRGALFADPAVDNIIDSETTPSLPAKRTDKNLQQSFDFAEKQTKQREADKKVNK